jgi:threonine aldolase
LAGSYGSLAVPRDARAEITDPAAAERFTGAKLIDVTTADGKLTPDLVAPLLGQARGEHSVRPAVVAISQVTELGTVYALDEIAALAELAHAHGLLLFVDGARLPNAAARLGCSLAQLATETGVDLLTLGGTKNGLLYGDAVVFLRPELARRAKFARKQAGQLASKMRFIAAQFGALLADDLWLDNARHANAMAVRLAAALGEVPAVDVMRAPQANSVFARLPAGAVASLQEWSFFWAWDSRAGTVRWMTSFATTDDDVSRFTAGVHHVTESLTRGHAGVGAE